MTSSPCRRKSSAGKRPAALLIVLLLGLGSLAQARKPRLPAAAASQTPAPAAPAVAKAADAPGDAGKAPSPAPPAAPVSIKKLEEAYRQAPNSEALFQLGVQAEAQGKIVEAQDFLRRYLADPLTDAAAPGRPEAERVMALVRPASGEVQILADQYGFVFVDGRLVGTLPLPLPLLVPVGQHVILVEMRDRTMQGRVKVPDGRGLEMRFSRASGAVVVTLPPAVILLAQYGGTPPAAELQRRLQQTVEQAIGKARLAVFSKDVALARSPKLASCLNTLDCQAQLASENEVDYALVMRVERIPGRAPAPVPSPAAVPGSPVPAAAPAPAAPPSEDSWSLQFGLIDAEAADSAATAKLGCPSCTGEQLSAQLPEAVLKLLKDGQGKPRGTLAVTSEPAGADVKLGTRVLGQTPYSHPMFAGSYEIIVEKPEFQPVRLPVEVKEGKPAQLAATLTAVEPAPAALVPPPVLMVHRRPRWRLITGGITLGVGAVLLGFGASALAVNGQCITDPVPPAIKCLNRFDTLSVGGSLVGVGAALSIGGVVLLALPGSLVPAAPK